MKTDKIFFDLFCAAPNFLKAFVAVVGKGKYRFQSITLKETERRCDAVFEPVDGSGVTYLVEFQMQLDGDIYPRVCMMRGMYKIREQPEYLCSVIIFKNRACDPETVDFQWMKRGCERDFQVLYLDRVVKKLKKRDPTHPVVAVLGPLVEKSKRVVKQKCRAWYRTLKNGPMPAKERDLLLKAFLDLLIQRIPDMSEAAIEEAVDYEAEYGHTTWAKWYSKKGEEKGLKIGEKRGEKRGARKEREKHLRAVDDLLTRGLISEEQRGLLRNAMKTPES